MLRQNEIVHLFLIGPKKTGTSSVYMSLKKAKLTSHNLWPKETNKLIHKGSKEYLDQRKSIIDISPEYFTSFRALTNFFRLKTAGEKFIIIIIKRDANTRLRSHVDYMLSKDEISENMSEKEWENIYLSEMNIWQTVDNLDIRELSLQEVYDFLECETNIKLDRNVRENEGGSVSRSARVLRLVKFFASILRRNTHSARLVEKLSPFLRKLIYRKSSRSISYSNSLLEEVRGVIAKMKAQNF